MRLETLLTHPAVEALGRALLHFLWQGSLLALLLWMLKAIVPASAARVRYAAASLIMLMMPVALVVTVTRDLRHEQSSTTISPVALSQAQATPEKAREALLAALPTNAPSNPMSGWLPGSVVCIWIGGVLLLSLRAAGGWIRAQRLKRRVLAVSSELEDVMTRLKRTLGISGPVRLYTSAIAQVPAVIGWLRPYILLPVTTVAGLSEPQLQAILAHELAHVRRHDYLVNLLQTVIETVLFYHPAAWWVGRRIRIEREHCCDDIAVAVCGSAIEYAGALAELEEIRERIPEPALAATGGDLLGRIRRLLGQQPSEDAASRSLGTIAAAAVIMLFVAGAPAVAQQPTFEVTSVKRNVSGAPRHFKMYPTFSVENSTLKELILMAYEVKDFQLSGGPGWINSDHYDIEAKSEASPVWNEDARRLQERRLQALLQDRFHLALHRETKELPIYTLTVAKGGLKLQPLKPGDCITLDPRKPLAPPGPGQKPSDLCGYGGFGRGLYENTTATMDAVAGALSTLLGRTVVDRTGITGVYYHVRLTFVPDESTVPMPGPDGPAETAPTVGAGPNIFTAVQEQLGLKLESAKGPVDVLVIDHADKPSEN